MKKEVSYVVKGEEWEKAKDKAFNKLNAKYRIDGFRKGKAPRSVFEKKRPGEIVMEAANSVIDDKYREIVLDKENMPVVRPSVEIKKLTDNMVEVVFTVITEPEVKLGEYKKLNVKKKEIKVSKKEVEDRINNLVREYAELMVKDDGKVESGDIAIIDFEGFKEGVAFDGGKGENYSLEIGSNTFIPGFEDGVIGMTKGETKDIKLTFPEDYGAKDLAGAKVVFKVTVNEIKSRVLPELDKDFFEDLGMDDVKTKEDLEKKVKEEIKTSKENEAENEYVTELLAAAVKNMECDIDDEIVASEAENMYSDMMERMKMQGLTEEIYLQYANTTREDIISHMKDEALRRLQNSYLLNAIIKEEKIEVSDKELDNEIKDMAKKYGTTKEELLSSIGGKDAVRFDLMARRAIDIMKGE